MAVYDIRSISQVGTSEPFELQVARGQIPGHTALFKYGYNPNIINVNETIWDVGGIYSYPPSALAMTVTSASGATDSGVKVTVSGLDGDFNELLGQQLQPGCSEEFSELLFLAHPLLLVM
jgi:hypothetical protein